MKFRVIVLPAAKEDLYGILAWIKERSPQGALSWFQQWNQALHSLENTPTTRAVAPESEDHDREIRQLLFKTRGGRTYRALFTIRDHDVFLLRIRGAGQNLLAAEELELPDSE